MTTPWFNPQHGDDGLAQHAHRLELRGGLGGLDWPELCPACGAPARERVPVRKVFVRRRRRRGGQTRYVIGEARVPFCPGCIAQHRTEDAAGPAPSRPLTYLRSFLIIPAVGAAVLACLILPAARREPWTEPGGIVAWVVVALFVALSLASVAATVADTRRFRVRPQTTVTRAFDYSDELGGVVEGRRRAYAIQDAAFAERFGAANRDRQWTGDDERRGRWRTGLVAGGLLAALLLWRLLAA